MLNRIFIFFYVPIVFLTAVLQSSQQSHVLERLPFPYVPKELWEQEIILKPFKKRFWESFGEEEIKALLSDLVALRLTSKYFNVFFEKQENIKQLYASIVFREFEWVFPKVCKRNNILLLETIIKINEKRKNWRKRDPNVIYKKQTALNHAVAYGNIKMMKMLIEHGAKAKRPSEIIRFESKIGPFEIAAKNNNVEILKILLIHGTIHKEALIEAVAHDAIEVIRFLFNHALTKDICNQNLELLLVRASERGSENVVDFLLKREVNPNIKAFGRPPLHSAAANNNINIVKKLLAYGADIDFLAKWGRTALDYAMIYNRKEVCLLLLARGADPNLISESNSYSYLHKTIIPYKNYDYMEPLIRHGADIEHRDYRKRTPLLQAVRYGYIKCVRLLLQKGADVNACNKDGNATLHYAVNLKRRLKAKAKIIPLLIAYGADVTMQNNKGQKPIDLMLELGYGLDICKHINPST